MSKTDHCKSVIFKSAGKVAVEDSLLEPLKDDEIRVKNLFSLVSAGTEILVLTGNQGEVSNKRIGYSSVGKVIEGWEGTSFKKGDLVSCFGPHMSVMDCSRERTETLFVPIREEHIKASTFLRLGGVAMHGLHRVNIKPGHWIVVFGLGIVGNLSLQLANLYSGGRALGIDPDAKRRKIAEDLGLRTIDSRQDDLIDAFKDISDKEADIIIETSGHPEALNQAFKIAAYNGQISLVAGHYGKRELDLKTDFQNKELSLIAARRVDLMTRATNYDQWTAAEYFKEVYRLIENNDLVVEPLISHCLKPEKAPEIYEKLRHKDPDVFGVLFDWREA